MSGAARVLARDRDRLTTARNRGWIVRAGRRVERAMTTVKCASTMGNEFLLNGNRSMRREEEIRRWRVSQQTLTRRLCQGALPLAPEVGKVAFRGKRVPEQVLPSLFVFELIETSGIAASTGCRDHLYVLFRSLATEGDLEFARRAQCCLSRPRFRSRLSSVEPSRYRHGLEQVDLVPLAKVVGHQ